MWHLYSREVWGTYKVKSILLFEKVLLELFLNFGWHLIYQNWSQYSNFTIEKGIKCLFVFLLYSECLHVYLWKPTATESPFNSFTLCLLITHCVFMNITWCKILNIRWFLASSINFCTSKFTNLDMACHKKVLDLWLYAISLQHCMYILKFLKYFNI